MNDISLDIETLGTGTNAAIVSIGACKFDLETGDIDREDVFDVNIDMESSNLGQIDGCTVTWWLTQDQVAIQRAFFHEYPIELYQALAQLSQWCGEGARLWTMGPLFDERIIVEACARIKIEPPTHFRHSRCVRTILDLVGRTGWKKDVGITNALKHGALSDAIYQAEMMCDAWRFLK